MKKVRSYVDVEENSDGVDMDVDQVSVADGKMREGDVRIPSLASEQVHHVVSQEGDGASYASEFPKKNPQEKDSDELHTDLCSETNLYGEWMMVQQRRRGSSNMPRLNPAENRGKSVMAEANGNMGNMRARVVQSQREGHVADATVDLGVTGGGGGAGSHPFRRQFQSFMHECKPRVVALMEPRVNGRIADHIIALLGFSNSFQVETNGFRGGIWILWEDLVQLEVTHIANQFVNMLVEDSEFKGKVQIMAVYACPTVAIRKHLWHHLLQLRPTEWCRRNCISALRRADDSWATAPSELTSIALKFYRNLFTSEGNITDSYSTRGLFPHVNRVALEHDYDPMSDIEVHGIDSWSVMAKVRGGYVEHVVGLQHVTFAAGNDSIGSHRVRRDDHGSWNPPPEGWWKLNKDGAGGKGGGFMTCGGVIHDENEVLNRLFLNLTVRRLSKCCVLDLRLSMGAL
ncbi:hypothetical protein V6N11_017591 [Hibiscus sabdariffa]|uniref:Uncharacterized protein n=1 Tax=Hibiscus sabdariffa TaxID=183260 RepID=A0ABR2TYH5_9ROSI